MTPNEKAPVSATNTGQGTENLAGNLAEQSSRPEVTVWNKYATDGIVPAPDVVEQTWGADLAGMPDWAEEVTNNGWAVSRLVDVPAEIHDGLTSDRRTLPAQVNVGVLQHAADKYPRVRMILTRTVREGKSRPRHERLAKISLHPWEVQPLIDALKAAQALTEEQW
ncbi:hypothetical protein [Corynebacterium provencense]|uniref:hypothetical protein n=1 Tax=Corynebacterium provencense TaxID=1737425 RepID=UPI0008295AA1|nr:hypothetical protein [Corynebacterium provencense]